MSNVTSISKRALLKSAENLLLEKAVSLGNSLRTPESDVADLVNSYISQNGRKGIKRMAELTFLSQNTIDRYGREGGTEYYRPMGDTTWRLLRFFGGEVTINSVHITPKYQNKPKDE